MQQILDTVETLCGPQGCPWSQAKSAQGMTTHLIEEAVEAVAAIQAGDMTETRAELGDLLIQAAYLIHLTGLAYAEVESGAVAKLRRRHPHVFAGLKVSGLDEINANWAAIKAQEQRAAGGGRPSPLPASGEVVGARERLNAVLSRAGDTPQGVAAVLGAALSWAHAVTGTATTP